MWELEWDLEWGPKESRSGEEATEFLLGRGFPEFANKDLTWLLNEINLQLKNLVGKVGSSFNQWRIVSW